jgi:UDP-N-acetylglucosamine 1-carboxyvinyltransferase
MASFIVEGGYKLKGDIEAQGAKNEALEVFCASLLTSEEVVIENVPEILDIKNLIDLLGILGAKVNKLAPGTWSIKADNLDKDRLYSESYLTKSAALRGSVMLVGPLLGRYGKAVISRPGGDKIGRRRLDTHFIGIQKLGANFEYDINRSLYEVRAKELKGCYMLLDEASVTGTANIIMAAVLAKGKTTIYNAACEPYIQQLCKMLNRMGAKISGIGSNLLTIDGVDKLGGCHHRILPDMIEVGSFIGMAAMTGSEITIRNVAYKELGMIPDCFRRLGIRLENIGDDIFIPA